MAQASKELYVTHSTRDYPNNIVSNTRFSNDTNISQFLAKIAKLTSDMEHIH